MRGEARALVLIVASRGLSEAVAFAVAAALLHAMTVGREAVPLTATSVALFGSTLVLAALLRERGTVRRSAGLAVVVIAASVAWGLSLPARSPDLLAVLTRVIGFGLLGEAYLWRVLNVARGLHRWREVRSDALLALALVVVAALGPGPVDRDALVALGLAVAVAGAVALSLARSTEELSLASGQIRGRPASSAAMGTAFAVGLLALAVAAALPWAQALLAQAARAAGPLLGDLLFALLLPLGYVAAYLVYLVQWLREIIRPTGIQIRLPQQPFDREADEQRLREMEALRPFVFGAVELLIALIGVALAIALVARLVQERRAVLPEGASVDREAAEGIGLGATLRHLFPKWAVRRRPPRDDGTPAAAIRRAYWRLLELAEREGPGRRADAETPAEHEDRLLRSGARWDPASAIVRAFEDLRYGERDPSEDAVAGARAALRAVERPAT